MNCPSCGAVFPTPPDPRRCAEPGCGYLLSPLVQPLGYCPMHGPWIDPA